MADVQARDCQGIPGISIAICQVRCTSGATNGWSYPVPKMPAAAQSPARAQDMDVHLGVGGGEHGFWYLDRACQVPFTSLAKGPAERLPSSWRRSGSSSLVSWPIWRRGGLDGLPAGRGQPDARSRGKRM
jgi:hypothetical protein